LIYIIRSLAFVIDLQFVYQCLGDDLLDTIVCSIALGSNS